MMREAAGRSFLLLIALAVSVVVCADPVLGFSSGITAVGPAGCNLCHAGGVLPDVRLVGPVSATPGSVVEFALEIDTVGIQNFGGLNVAVDAGQLQTGGTSSTNTQLLFGEITHTGPKAAAGKTVRFSFLWEAPLAPGSAALTAWGNAVDGNGATTNDSAPNSPEESEITVVPIPSGLDSYKCYQGKDLQNPPFQRLSCPSGVDTSDQFTTECVDLQKVKFVCAPVSIEGSPIIDLSAHLVCYQIKGAALAPRPAVEVITQFQTSRFELKKPKLICVPGTKIILP